MKILLVVLKSKRILNVRNLKHIKEEKNSQRNEKEPNIC
jgi:hypothetical protein